LWLIPGTYRGFAAEPEEVKPKTVEALEKDLVAAVGAQQFDQAKQLVSELAATGEIRGFEAIIKSALTGADYALERHAGALLAGSTDPKVRARVFEGIVKDPKYKTRIVLLAVAARMEGDPRALDAIHAALKDPMKPVVFSALQWIRELKRIESVDAIIDELEVRERKSLGRVCFDMLRTLKELTSQELSCAGDWRNYWEAHKAGLSKPRKSGGRTATYKSGKFFSVVLDSDRVMFVIDISASMTTEDEPPEPSDKATSGPAAKGKTAVARKPEKPKEPRKKRPERERIVRVKAELVRAVGELEPTTNFGIISFNHEVSSLWASRTLKPATPENKTAAIQWVKELQASGATRTDLALEEALSIPEVDSIYLLTDGAPKGMDNLKMPIEPILQRAKELNRFVKARIHTISFQQIRDKNMVRFCRELSLQNDGGEPTLLP
jgi:hypothetical protein